MKKQDCYYIGKIVSKFSFKGEVLLKLETKELVDYRFKTLFVEIDGLLSPFIVEKFSKYLTAIEYPKRKSSWNIAGILKKQNGQRIFSNC